MSPLEMYIERAAGCREQAAAEKLTNVRERCLRSAEAWQQMAERARLAEKYRAEEAVRKAAPPPHPFAGLQAAKWPHV